MKDVSNGNNVLRIATIGFDRSIAELVRCGCASGGFELVAVYDVGDTANAHELVEQLGSGGEVSDSWEDLLGEAVADVVVVAEFPSDSAAQVRRAEQLRRLVSANIALVAIHPVCDMLLAYELEMIRTDMEALLFPYVPLQSFTWVDKLRDFAASGASELGKVEQLNWDRFDEDSRRTSHAVLQQLAKDAVVYRELMGEITSVSATGATSTSDIANLSVHLTGSEGSPTGRWSVGPVRERKGAELLAIGSERTARIWMTAPFNVEFEDAATHRLLHAEQDSAASAASRFWTNVSDTMQRGARWNGTSWTAICRALEVVDAVERSIKRRRTIELYHEQITEHDTFKSMMAAGGCGMLLWVLALLGLAAVVEGLQLPFRDSIVWRLWPIALAGPLAVFLGLQLFQVVYAKTKHDD